MRITKAVFFNSNGKVHTGTFEKAPNLEEAINFTSILIECSVKRDYTPFWAWASKHGEVFWDDDDDDDGKYLSAYLIGDDGTVVKFVE